MMDKKMRPMRIDKMYRPALDGPKNPKNPMKPGMAKPMKPRLTKEYNSKLDGPKTPTVNPKMSALRRMRGMK
jgi:hypothetical protein